MAVVDEPIPAPELFFSETLNNEPVTPVEVLPLSESAPPELFAEEAASPSATTGDEPVAAPESLFPEALNNESEAPVEVPPLSPSVPPELFAEETAAPASATAHESARESSLTETEGPEEVLIVESLLPETSAQELPASVAELPGEEPETVPSVPEDKKIVFDFSADSDLQEESALSEDLLKDILSETELKTLENSETIPQDVSEISPADEIIETEGVVEAEDVVESEGVVEAESEGVAEVEELRGVSEEVSEPAHETVLEPSDDFATDTLAELYIAQGFFEMAIEIYERMLVEKPNSRGLQDKLATVRAEAARTLTPTAEEKKDLDSLVDQAVKESVLVKMARAMSRVMRGCPMGAICLPRSI